MVKVKPNVAFEFCNGTYQYWELLSNLKKVNSKTREFYNRIDTENCSRLFIWKFIWFIIYYLNKKVYFYWIFIIYIYLYFIWKFNFEIFGNLIDSLTDFKIRVLEIDQISKIVQFALQTVLLSNLNLEHGKSFPSKSNLNFDGLISRTALDR